MNSESNNDFNEISEDWWKEQNVIRKISHSFSQHLIGLYIGYTIEGKQCGTTYTGFLLNYRKRHHWWVTAGHVIEEIEFLFNSGAHKINSCRWIDNCSNDEARAIPVDYNRIVKHKIVNNEVDYGVIKFNNLDFHAICGETNNIWLTEETWRDLEKANPEGFYLVGYPKETNQLKTIQKDGRYDGVLQFNPICIPIKRITQIKKNKQCGFWSHPGWFYGKVLTVTTNEGQILNNIEGMSGGPIFSIERTPNGGIKYYMFAVQSSWLPDSKVLSATPINYFAQLLDLGIEQ